MKSKRQKWAIKRNWLIMRLRGARSIYNYENQKFIERLIPKDNHRIFDNAEVSLHYLIEELSKSKYKE